MEENEPQKASKTAPSQKTGVSASPKGSAPTAKPAAAKSAPAKAKGNEPALDAEPLKERRRFVWTTISAFLVTNFLMFLRFFFPRTLFEPSSRFRIGSPSDFGLGVDERFKQSHRIWVVREPEKMFVIFAKCTHLGCTPNWLETDHKFKCPCHGSGYDMEGVNFEGPAPRPMDRAHVELDAEGQIVVDTSKLYSCPPGGVCEFDTDPNSYLVTS